MKKNNLLPFSLVIIILLFVSCETDNEIEPEPEIDNIHIPDEHFKNALLNEDVVDTNKDKVGDTDADVNNDGEIQRSEAEAIESLILHFDYTNLERYVDLTGIEHFTNLRILKLTGKGGAGEEKIDPQMTYNFTALKKLEFLQVNHLASNQVETIDLSGLTSLVEVNLSYNRPTFYPPDHGQPEFFIDVNMEGNTNVTKLSFENSFLLVDLCEVPSVEVLDMRYLEGGEPEEFDLHCLTNLEWLDFSENSVKKLILKNSSVLTTLVTTGVESANINAIYRPIEYVCIDDIQEEWDQISTLIDENSVVTTDCSF